MIDKDFMANEKDIGGLLKEAESKMQDSRSKLLAGDERRLKTK